MFIYSIYLGSSSSSSLSSSSLFWGRNLDLGGDGLYWSPIGGAGDGSYDTSSNGSLSPESSRQSCTVRLKSVWIVLWNQYIVSSRIASVTTTVGLISFELCRGKSITIVMTFAWSRHRGLAGYTEVHAWAWWQKHTQVTRHPLAIVSFLRS
jgi:hypothetical protein